MTVDVGRIKIVWQNAYNGATTYKKDDAVFYLGSAWICTAATSTGNAPAANSAFWSLMVQGQDVAYNLDVSTLSTGTLTFPATGNVINVVDNGSGANVVITTVANVVPGALYRFINTRTSPTNQFTLSATSSIFGSTTTIDSVPSSPGAIVVVGVTTTKIRVI